MPAIVTFDPIALRIIEVDTGAAVNTLSAVEIYSEWKDWVLSDNGGYPIAFRQVAEEYNPTRDIGPYFFLQNGWKIRPAEYNHKLIVDGDMISDPTTESIFVNTLGPFTVNVETSVSNLISTITADTATVVNAILDEPLAAHLTDGTFGDAIAKLYAILGLDGMKPLTVTKTRRYVGPSGSPDIDQTIVESPPGTVTVTRQ